MLCPSKQIHQLKQEKSYFFGNTYFYFLQDDQNMEISIYCKKTWFLSFSIGGFVEKYRALL